MNKKEIYDDLIKHGKMKKETLNRMDLITVLEKVNGKVWNPNLTKKTHVVQNFVFTSNNWEMTVIEKFSISNFNHNVSIFALNTALVTCLLCLLVGEPYFNYLFRCQDKADVLNNQWNLEHKEELKDGVNDEMKDL